MASVSEASFSAKHYLGLAGSRQQTERQFFSGFRPCTGQHLTGGNAFTAREYGHSRKMLAGQKTVETLSIMFV